MTNTKNHFIVLYMATQKTLTPFQKLLHEQIAEEFFAAHQYLAIAVYYDSVDLPRLATYFYRQALEERNHGLRIIQYFLDRDLPVTIPDVKVVINEFDNYRKPLLLAYDQEKRVTDQFTTLAQSARDSADYVGEQFLQWFLKEQVEEVSTMHTLITVSNRADGNTFDLENFVARELLEATKDQNFAPKAAGEHA